MDDLDIMAVRIEDPCRILARVVFEPISAPRGHRAKVRAGWKPGEIRSKMFRHTYCATRLQTLDDGAPVREYTVAKEMGHGGTAMVRKVHGHLGRHCADAVEYRVEQFAHKLRGPP